jgi:hypothetical protein
MLSQISFNCKMNVDQKSSRPTTNANKSTSIVGKTVHIEDCPRVFELLNEKKTKLQRLLPNLKAIPWELV